MRYLLLIIACLTLVNGYAQQQENVDFVRISGDIVPNFEDQTIWGEITCSFEIVKPSTSVFLDAHIDEVKLMDSSKAVELKLEDGKLIINGDFSAVGFQFDVKFRYKVKPTQTLYFFEDQLWTQGQGKYTSYWLPSLDDMNDKIEFDLFYHLPSEYSVIANGDLLRVEEGEKTNRWMFNMQAPMSSYLVMLAAGKFDKKSIETASGLTIENYYLKGEEQTVEPTYRYTKEIFDFLEKKIGVPYPWQNYKQVPVRDFLYAGMENTTATVFASSFVVDSIGFNDKNYVNVNAHELAHQWFGNLVTEVSAADHWLHEGFASYYALLAEREIFGDDYYYWKLFNTAEQLRAQSDQGNGEALSNPKASSLTFYEKGTWALIALDQLLGTLDFDRAVKAFLEQFAYQNATLDDFFGVVTAVTGKDMTNFRKDWIDQTSFPSYWALDYLSESEFMEEYIELEVMRKLPLSQKSGDLLAAIMGPNEYLGQEAVIQLAGEPLKESILLYSSALKDDQLLVRQAVVQSIDEIPLALQSEFEVLLRDDSYITQETALYRLWSEFPEQRAKYLDAMDGAIGFSEKNIRQLWLTLAIVTPAYRADKKKQYTQELMDYSSAAYSFEVRELALSYLTEIQIINREVLKNLLNACVHPNWGFRTTARELLNRQLDKPIAKSTLAEIRRELPEKEANYLDRVLK